MFFELFEQLLWIQENICDNFDGKLPKGCKFFKIFPYFPLTSGNTSNSGLLMCLFHIIIQVMLLSNVSA